MTNKENDPYAALRIKEFRLFISARFLLTIGVQMQAVLVGWQVYSITKDPLALGLIGLSEALPSISVALYAGHIADTVSRKKIIMLTLGLLSFCSICLLLYSSFLRNGNVRFGTTPIYLIIFLSGIARGFIGPALFSFMPQLINKASLFPNAITWNSATWQTAAVAGPAVAGILYGLIGISNAYLVDCILVILSLLLFTIIKSKPVPTPENNDLTLLNKLSAGLKFVFSNQIILGAISLDLFAVLFGGATALLPIFASEILHTGPMGLGFLRAAPAFGAVLMAIFMAYKPIRTGAGKKMLLAVAGYGICIILFAISKDFFLSFGLLLFSGMLDSISVIIRSTLIQTLTPDYMKGRVSAVNNIFIGSSNEIGAFESGFVAKLLGVIPSVIFGGCMTLLVVFVASKKAKKLVNLNL